MPAVRPFVLQLGPWPPPHGGVQVNLTAIHELLLDRGWRSEVVNLTRYRRQPGGGIHYPASALALARLLLRLRPSILHVHIGGGMPLRLVLLLLYCTLLPGRRAVLTLHSGGFPDSPEDRSAVPRLLRGFVLRRLDRVVAVNPQLAHLFHSYGVAAHKVRTIAPHALADELPRSPLPGAIEAFFATHDPVLLSMGWLEPEYDFPLQIDALGPLRKRHPRAGLLILGGGRLESELQARAAHSGCADHICMPGDQPHDIALQCLARASVLLRTTWYDGDSISVREALHWGTPVVASDNGMRPAGVHLIPARDLAALLSAIPQALAHRAESRETAEAQRATVGTGRRNIEAVLELYDELLRGQA